MRSREYIFFGTLLLGTLSLLSEGRAAEEAYTLTVKDHRFSPGELKVPAGRKVRIVVDNQDPTAEEFESYDLNREKVVSGNSKITLFVGPLKPGTYKFFGEFHQDTAQGVLVAVESKEGIV